MNKHYPLTILLAEDDPDDQYLISEALEESGVLNKLYIVEDGEQLLNYLFRLGKYADEERFPAPGLILLDLNMPKMDGREALEKIQADSRLRRIPIIVLTTSKSEEDMLHSYDLGVGGFITKPVSFDGLLDVMQAISAYWLKVVSLPEND